MLETDSFLSKKMIHKDQRVLWKYEQIGEYKMSIKTLHGNFVLCAPKNVRNMADSLWP